MVVLVKTNHINNIMSFNSLTMIILFIYKSNSHQNAQSNYAET